MQTVEITGLPVGSRAYAPESTREVPGMDHRFYEEYTALKRRILEKQFSRMNQQQLEAVFQIKGPLLILAGAGSGKTTVLVNRVSYLVRFGNAYHSRFMPPQIAEDDMVFLRQAAQGGQASQERLTALLADQPIRRRMS